MKKEVKEEWKKVALKGNDEPEWQVESTADR